jgi:hypothetical protein
MTTYRVLKVIRKGGGPITGLVVKTDTGKRLKNKRTMTKDVVLDRLNSRGAAFYKIDLATGKTGRLRKDAKNLITIGDGDAADNLE